MGTLYLVATPIGNLDDITLRALRVLKEVPLIAAEDTRTTNVLLAKYHIATALTSYHDHNKRAKLPQLLTHLKEHDLALVSDAGTPGLNDPGYELVQAAIVESIPTVSVPGPSIVPTAIVVSGLPTDQFLYLGYLPRKSSERKRLLTSVVQQARTLFCLETPHRLQGALEDILQTLGNRRVAVCREMTKLHEEVFRGTVQQALEHFATPRGEFTLVIEGASGRAQGDTLNQDALLQRLDALRRQGLPPKAAVKQVAQESGRPTRELYRLWLELTKQPGDV
jgi:16S rRNA (cytidine1402-2'-O)-methyltransferase